MRDVVFAMELRGQAAPVEGHAGVLRAHTGGRGPLGETVHFTSEAPDAVGAGGAPADATRRM
jgi:hypothetical protein